MRKEAQTALISLSLVISGCAPETKPQLTPVAAVTPTPSIEAQIFLTQEKVDQYKTAYFPELMNIDPFEVGTLKTEQGTPVTWLNYTEGKFNPRVAKEMLSFFYDFVPPDFVDSKVSATYNGKPEDVYYAPRSTKKEKVLFIVPDSMRLPGILDPYPGATSFHFENNEAVVSYIRPLGQTRSALEETATAIFATEICHQGVNIKSSNWEFEILLQELYCNSLGWAYAAKQKGLSYNEYAQTFRGSHIDIPLPVGGTKKAWTEIIVFTESVYKSIPVTEKILSYRR